MTPEQLQALRFAKYTRLGTWIAAVSGLSIVLIEVITRISFLRERLLVATGVIIFTGVLLLLARLSSYRRQPTLEEILHFYRNSHYWGAALVAAGCVVMIIAQPKDEPPKPAKPAPVIVKETIPEPPPVVEKAPEPVPVVFPEVRLTSVVLNGAKSSALLNDRVIVLGERLLDMRLVDVTETNVTLELRGQRKVVSF